MTKPKNIDPTDLGNSQRFVRKFGDTVRFAPQENTWYIWDGKKWFRDNMRRIMEMASQVADDLYVEAEAVAKSGDRAKAREVFNHAMALRSKNKLKAMVQTAGESIEAIKINVAQLDTDHSLLNCANGIVDMSTGRRLDHDPSKLMTRCAIPSFLPQAPAPRWTQFLNEIFENDRDLIQWVQRAVGYTATGWTREQVLFILHGPGANGKSTFLEVVKAILDDYAKITQMDALLDTGVGNVRSLENMGQLKGVRMAIASETQDQRRFNEAAIKRMTGEDTLHGAQLYGSRFDFVPEFKLWLAVNHLPSVRDDTHSFWRRVRVIPFVRKFERTEIDPGLKSKLLMEEGAGILRWIVQGAVHYHRMGLGTTPAVEQAVAEYEYEQDTLSRFISEETAVSDMESVQSSALYTRYTTWCSENSIAPDTQNQVGRSLRKRRFEQKRTRAGIVYQGIGLRGDSDE